MLAFDGLLRVDALKSGFRGLKIRGSDPDPAHPDQDHDRIRTKKPTKV